MMLQSSNNVSSTGLGYVVALLSVAGAAAATLALRQISPDLTFVLFFAAVAVSARFGGRAPSLAAALLATLVSAVLFLPSGSVGIAVLVRLLAFLAVAVVVGSLAGGRRSAESALHNSQLSFRLLVEGVSDYAIFLLDPRGTIESWNTGAERIKGYRAAEVLGRSIAMFYTPEDAAAGLPQRYMRAALQAGHFQGQGWRVRKDGSRFWADVTLSALYDDSGRHVGFAKVTRDLTERKQAEDEVRALNAGLERRVAERTAELSAINRSLEEFNYSVSHDLRAPLRGIRGFAEILQRRYRALLPAEGQRYLDNISDSGARMDRLIDDLLAYSRLGRGGGSMSAVDVAQVVSEVVEDLGGRVKPGQIRMAADLPVVRGDVSLLRQVFLNLIDNALAYRRLEAEPRIEIDWTPQDGQASIEVRDNGLGIPPQHHERIFNLFQRLHSDETHPGTGLGLAIVKKSVELLNGTIGIRSIPGQGSTFLVRLPLAGPNNGRAAPDAAQEPS